MIEYIVLNPPPKSFRAGLAKTSVRKKSKKPKRKLSAKQLAALARGRFKRRRKIKKKSNRGGRALARIPKRRRLNRSHSKMARKKARARKGRARGKTRRPAARKRPYRKRKITKIATAGGTLGARAGLSRLRLAAARVKYASAGPMTTAANPRRRKRRAKRRNPANPWVKRHRRRKHYAKRPGRKRRRLRRAATVRRHWRLPRKVKRGAKGKFMSVMMNPFRKTRKRRRKGGKAKRRGGRRRKGGLKVRRNPSISGVIANLKKLVSVENALTVGQIAAGVSSALVLPEVVAGMLGKRHLVAGKKGLIASALGTAVAATAALMVPKLGGSKAATNVLAGGLFGILAKVGAGYTAKYLGISAKGGAAMLPPPPPADAAAKGAKGMDGASLIVSNDDLVAGEAAARAGVGDWLQLGMGDYMDVGAGAVFQPGLETF